MTAKHTSIDESEARSHLEMLIKVCDMANPGAFENGNNANGLDEGEVLTSRRIEEAREFLKRLPPPNQPKDLSEALYEACTNSGITCTPPWDSPEWDNAAQIVWLWLEGGGANKRAEAIEQEVITLRRWNAELGALRTRQNDRILRGNQCMERLMGLLRQRPNGSKALSEWSRNVNGAWSVANRLIHEQPEDPSPKESGIK
jgi:hypothetical protein